MRLGLSAERVLSARSFAGFLQVAGDACVTGGVKQFGHRAGRVGMYPVSFARQDRHRSREGLSGSPFFGFPQSLDDPVLVRHDQADYLGASLV
jgi:hypothetical protein